MPATAAIELEVRYVECDMQGHVFNAHYLTWFDMAHTALLEAWLPGGYGGLLELGCDVVVAESGVRYLAPARYPDRLTVTAEPEPLGRTSMTTRFTVTRGDDDIATGFLRHVCVDRNAMGKREWPDAVRSALDAAA